MQSGSDAGRGRPDRPNRRRYGAAAALNTGFRGWQVAGVRPVWRVAGQAETAAARVEWMARFA